MHQITRRLISENSNLDKPSCEPHILKIFTKHILTFVFEGTKLLKCQIVQESKQIKEVCVNVGRKYRLARLRWKQGHGK
jgi:hypothetical protein